MRASSHQDARDGRRRRPCRRCGSRCRSPTRARCRDCATMSRSAPPGRSNTRSIGSTPTVSGSNATRSARSLRHQAAAARAGTPGAGWPVSRHTACSSDSTPCLAHPVPEQMGGEARRRTAGWRARRRRRARARCGRPAAAGPPRPRRRWRARCGSASAGSPRARGRPAGRTGRLPALGRHVGRAAGRRPAPMPLRSPAPTPSSQREPQLRRSSAARPLAPAPRRRRARRAARGEGEHLLERRQRCANGNGSLQRELHDERPARDLRPHLAARARPCGRRARPPCPADRPVSRRGPRHRPADVLGQRGELVDVQPGPGRDLHDAAARFPQRRRRCGKTSSGSARRLGTGLPYAPDVRRRPRRREPDRARVDRLADDAAHRGHLVVGGRPLGGLVAQHVEAQRRVPDAWRRR